MLVGALINHTLLLKSMFISRDEPRTPADIQTASTRVKVTFFVCFDKDVCLLSRILFLAFYIFTRFSFERAQSWRASLCKERKPDPLFTQNTFRQSHSLCLQVSRLNLDT